MAHYLIAHLNGGRYGDVQILSECWHRRAAPRGGGINRWGNYRRDSTAWAGSTVDLGQTKTFSHGGNVPDFSAFMALVPEQKKGVVLLLNADPYGLPLVTEEVGMGVTALLAGQQPPPIRLDFIQWIMRFLPLIPLLQMVGVIATLRDVAPLGAGSGSSPRRGTRVGAAYPACH